MPYTLLGDQGDPHDRRRQHQRTQEARRQGPGNKPAHGPKRRRGVLREVLRFHSCPSVEIDKAILARKAARSRRQGGQIQPNHGKKMEL